MPFLLPNQQRQSTEGKIALNKLLINPLMAISTKDTYSKSEFKLQAIETITTYNFLIKKLPRK